MMKLQSEKTVLLIRGELQVFSIDDSLSYILYRIWFRPRILRDVTSVDWSCTILGQKSSLPLYIVGHDIVR